MTPSPPAAPRRAALTAAAFAALVALLAALVVVGFQHFRRLAEARRWSEHTLAVVNESEQIEAAALEMESAFRGFALTGDTAMVQRWSGASQAFRAHLDRAVRLTEDNPAQTRRLRELARLQSAWEAQQRATGLLVPGRRLEARAAAADPAPLRGRAAMMEAMRALLREVGAAEELLLAEREANANRLQRVTERLLLAGGVFAVLLGGGLAVLVTRQGRRLREYNRDLEAEVAERRQAQRAVERLSGEKAMLLDSVGEGIYGVDALGFSTFLNPAGERLLRLPAGEVIGRPVEAVLQFERDGDGGSGVAAVRETLRTGQASTAADSVLRRADGTRVPVELAATPLREDDRLVGAVVTFRDVGERREVERVKAEFVAVVSHELRTPLTAMRGALGLLASGRAGPVPDGGRRLLEIALQNGERLGRLVDDILDLERIAVGKAELDLRPHDAAELARAAAATMEPVAERAGVALRVETAPAPVQADADRLLQVLTNLLSNALKFSPEGAEVRLSVGADEGGVHFRVADRGRGIPADKLESIFERFQQVDSSDSRDKGGTGLGLAIARGIVEQHGGRIWAESAPGQGSTFHVVLPPAGTGADATQADDREPTE